MSDYSIVDYFLLTFVPLFIAVDAIGNLPFVIALSTGMDRHERNRMIIIAVITALVLGLIFLFLGQFILNLMGISVGSFAIGGGIVLLVIAINFIISSPKPEIYKEEMVAVVPIGTPLTVGPATITTLLLLATQFPTYWVLISFLVNIVLVWLFFYFSSFINRVLGRGGMQAVSKVASLLLAAIAVNMVFRGLSLLGLINVSI